jgi:hypothetical protein
VNEPFNTKYAVEVLSLAVGQLIARLSGIEPEALALMDDTLTRLEAPLGASREGTLVMDALRRGFDTMAAAARNYHGDGAAPP